MELIWTNDIYAYAENNEIDENMIEGINEMIGEFLYEAKKKLDRPLGRQIVCIARVANWDGMHNAFQWVGKNAKDCIDFAIKNGETVRIFTQDKDLMATSTGHDNPVTPTTMWFRVLRDGIDEYEFEDEVFGNWQAGFDLTEPLNLPRIYKEI